MMSQIKPAKATNGERIKITTQNGLPSVDSGPASIAPANPLIPMK